MSPRTCCIQRDLCRCLILVFERVQALIIFCCFGNLKLQELVAVVAQFLHDLHIVARAGVVSMLRCAAWPLIVAMMVVAVEPPEGCPSDLWTFACSGGATCETLAVAGLTCSSVAVIDNCKDVCAEPCCITTTSTTRTSTLTTVTHTETTYTTTETETHTSTGTSTQTDTTTTITKTTVTNTYTGSTLTTSQTDTVTASMTSTMTPIATTREMDATTWGGPAAKITVTMAVRVDENAEGYIQDPKVKEAYKELMVEVTGLDAGLIYVEMDPVEGDEISVIYVVTIPYEETENGPEPIIPVSTVQQKLAQLNMESMNKMLDEKMEAAGVSYGQEVQKVDDDQTTAVNGASSKVASVVMYLAGTLLMNAF